MVGGVPGEVEEAVAVRDGEVGRDGRQFVVVDLGDGEVDLARVVVPGVEAGVARAVGVVVVLCGHQRHGLGRVPVVRGEDHVDGDDVGSLALERDVGVVLVADGEEDADLGRFAGLGGEHDLVAGFAAFGHGEGGDGVALAVLDADAALGREVAVGGC